MRTKLNIFLSYLRRENKEPLKGLGVTKIRGIQKRQLKRQEN